MPTVVVWVLSLLQWWEAARVPSPPQPRKPPGATTAAAAKAAAAKVTTAVKQRLSPLTLVKKSQEGNHIVKSFFDDTGEGQGMGHKDGFRGSGGGAMVAAAQ